MRSGFVGPQRGPRLCCPPRPRPSAVTVRAAGKAIEGHRGKAKPRIQICFSSSGFYHFYFNYSSMFKAMKKTPPIWLARFRHLERECTEIHLRDQSLWTTCIRRQLSDWPTRVHRGHRWPRTTKRESASVGLRWAAPRDGPSAEERKGCRGKDQSVSSEKIKGNLKFQEYFRSSQGRFGSFCKQVAWTEICEGRKKWNMSCTWSSNQT